MRSPATTPDLSEAYRQHLKEHGFSADPAQEALVASLQKLLDGLVDYSNAGNTFTRWLQGRLRRAVPSPVRGIYVWGDVGRGKTFLMNLFFRNLPITDKTRVHFHQFMRETHVLLAENRNIENPLHKVARSLAKRSRLLYLDEFHVVDIGDAMILAGLLKCLRECGVVLAMTSNCVPDALYAGGLQRQHFLPVIALIKEYSDVFELNASYDYRLQLMSRANLYLTPANAASEHTLDDNFRQLITDPPERDAVLDVNSRDIPARCLAGGVVWFDFDVICGGPRAPADYLEIAHCYEIILVSGIPVFDYQDDTARRFINMIDTFYNCHVRFIASAAAAPEDLYRRGRLAQEFYRTASRLVEMQSPDYIARAHA